jgi:hypothetical protein
MTHSIAWLAAEARRDRGEGCGHLKSLTTPIQEPDLPPVRLHSRGSQTYVIGQSRFENVNVGSNEYFPDESHPTDSRDPGDHFDAISCCGGHMLTR